MSRKSDLNYLSKMFNIFNSKKANIGEIKNILGSNYVNSKLKSSYNLRKLSDKYLSDRVFAVKKSKKISGGFDVLKNGAITPKNFIHIFKEKYPGVKIKGYWKSSSKYKFDYSKIVERDELTGLRQEVLSYIKEYNINTKFNVIKTGEENLKRVIELLNEAYLNTPEGISEGILESEEGTFHSYVKEYIESRL